MVNDDHRHTSDSMQARLLRAALSRTVLPIGNAVPTNGLGVAFARTVIEVLLAAANVGIPRTWHQIADATGTIRGEWIGATTPGRPVLYYLHGSGYTVCSPRTHRGLVSELARRTGRSAFVLDYRLGPEHRFPAAHDDTLAGYRWLLDLGHRPENIVVAGDSAGGHLALTLCGQLRTHRLPQPAAVVALSPLVDGTFDTAAATETQVHDPFVSARTARRFIGNYTQAADPRDPRMNAALDVGPDLPPILIQAGGREMLRADAELYAAAARDTGAACTVQIWDNMFHVFQLAYRVLPEARAALRAITEFMEAAAADTDRVTA